MTNQPAKVSIGVYVYLYFVNVFVRHNIPHVPFLKFYVDNCRLPVWS